MESTGVYWIPVFEILEARGLEVVLVNAHHLRNVRGRKTDVTDCEWLRELHSVGRLSASFRPAAEIVVLRTYLRQRASLVEQASSHIQRMQKSLTQMNLMLHLVLSDITGTTGLKIVRSILDGERDPAVLANHRDHRCKASSQEIIAALTGNYRVEHLFTLKQNFDAYEFDRQQIAECDSAIQKLIDSLATQQPPPTTELPAARRPLKRKSHEPSFDIRTPLHRLTGGTDLSQIDGIGPHAALQLVAEIGTDMSRWPSAGHFTSWLTLAPNNKISGGRLLSSRTQPSANRAAAILRRCAMSLMRTSTALGAFYRRLAARTGKPTAITATARKLACWCIACCAVISPIPIRGRGICSTPPNSPAQFSMQTRASTRPRAHRPQHRRDPASARSFLRGPTQYFGSGRLAEKGGTKRSLDRSNHASLVVRCCR
jgi:transposase